MPRDCIKLEEIILKSEMDWSEDKGSQESVSVNEDSLVGQ